MTIIRELPIVGKIEIELTQEELRKAFWELERAHRRADCESVLDNLHYFENISEEKYQQLKDDEDFFDRCIDCFEERYDCNVAENDLWEDILDRVAGF